MSHRIVLDVEAVEGQSERRTFDKSKVTIGRAPESDIQVTRRERVGVPAVAYLNCANHHGMLEVRGEALVLHDIGTTNGWHCVNYGKVEPHRGICTLKVGDRYYVGDTRITIVAFE
jgi:predicted component of type VI protein secretion system